MVQAMINISKEANQIINMVKARYSLKDKSQAIEKMATVYGSNFIEPDLKPEFIQQIEATEHEKGIRVDDFDSRYELN